MDLKTLKPRDMVTRGQRTTLDLQQVLNKGQGDMATSGEAQLYTFNIF